MGSLRARREQAPPAPWGRFPLVELCVLLALVIGGIGLATGGSRGVLMIVCAAALGSLAGLELAIREHFSGYRSHTLVLSGAAAAALAALSREVLVLVAPATPVWVVLVIAGLGFGLAAWRLQGAFRRRAGGYVAR